LAREVITTELPSGLDFYMNRIEAKYYYYKHIQIAPPTPAIFVSISIFNDVASGITHGYPRIIYYTNKQIHRIDIPRRTGFVD